MKNQYNTIITSFLKGFCKKKKQYNHYIIFMILFCFFVSITISRTYQHDYQFNDLSDVKLIQGYNRALLTVPAGKGLMMVEWDDAILSISVPKISQKKAKLTKHSGFSVFLFNQAASIDIMFHSQISYSIFTCPTVYSLDGALQLISNFAKNELTIVKTSSDIYFKIFDDFDMSGNLKKSGVGSAKLIYNKDNNWIETKDISSFNLNDLRAYAIVSPSGLVTVEGKVNLYSKYQVNPTVPTYVNLAIEGTIKENQNNYKETIAYGGSGKESKSMTFNSLVNTQYVTISNNIENSRYYYLYAKDINGDYKLIDQDHPYIDTRTNSFKVQVYMRSAMGLENCSDYVFVTELDSSQLKIEDFNLAYEKINDEHIPDACLYIENGDGGSSDGSGKGKNKNGNKTGIIVGVVIAVIVVIAIVVVVVIFVLKRKKSDQSTQEMKTSNSSLL